MLLLAQRCKPPDHHQPPGLLSAAGDIVQGQLPPLACRRYAKRVGGEICPSSAACRDDILVTCVAELMV